jgi:hypothetical protein
VLIPPRFPAHIRALSLLERSVRKLGVRILPFEPDTLMKIASKQAGLTDFGDDAVFREGLATLCRAAEADARFSLVGRLSIRQFVVRTLVNRLRLVEAQKQEPEVESIELIPPLIIMGMHRSGTTFLHHMLTTDPSARPIYFWELWEPIPGKGEDRRRATLQAQLAQIKGFDPHIDGKHHFDADNPEECMLLLDPTFVSLSFWAFAPVFGYLEWLFDQDQQAPYRAYKWYLQRFQRDNPGKRLTLKAPVHTWALTELLAAIPSAKVVQTHRDMGDVLPSLHSFVYSLHALTTDHIDVPRMCEANMRFFEHMIARNEASRAAGASIIDVQYEALVRDPVACVRRIYHEAQLDFDETVEERLHAFVRGRPKEKFGGHRYCAEDFGTTKDAFRTRFGAYGARRVSPLHEA